MNIEQLRHSLKLKWLRYYQQNRSWLVKLQVWGTENGKRCPASSLILGTVSSLEPELTELLPLIVDLNSNPDQIVFALGLNFDPDEELKLMSDEQLQSITETTATQTNGNSNQPLDDIAIAQSETKSDDLLVQILADENEVDATNVAGVRHHSSSTDKSFSSGKPKDKSFSSGKPNYAGVVLSILALITSIAFVFASITG